MYWRRRRFFSGRPFTPRWFLFGGYGTLRGCPRERHRACAHSSASQDDFGVCEWLT